MPTAQADDFRLPAPGVRVGLSPEYNPPILKGLKVHPNNPFRFDFILDQGDSSSVIARSEATKQSFIKEESTRLIKYFLASLTIPEKDLWVNLSPYEKDRIIPQSFGLTEMGRDLLAEDYMLKQITASLIYPEDEIGKKFWKRIYEEAAKKFGTTNIPVNTFNKVWIVPEKAVVYENAKAGTAYVVESKLKVMLEQDYLSLSRHSERSEESLKEQPSGSSLRDSSVAPLPQNDVNALGSQIVREIVIPELTKEVNEGKNFSQLRQVYNSLILATWYKKKIKDSILAQVYEDKKKITGVEYKSSVIARRPALGNPADEAISKRTTNDVEAIYQRYLAAFKKGAYNYIKEEQDPITQETIPRKYFSGGTAFNDAAMASALRFTKDEAVVSQADSDHAQVLEVELGQAQPQLIQDDRGMIANEISRRLEGAKEYNQIALLTYDSPKEKELIIEDLNARSRPFIEITQENFSAIIGSKDEYKKGVDIFIAPVNVRFVNEDQVSGFLKTINLRIIGEPAFESVEDVYNGQGRHFSQPINDYLTGLLNRAGIISNRIVNRTIRTRGYVGILDIDYFKAINELFGHKEGDKVLKEFAKNLQLGSRAGDIVGRWGGEEFVVVMPVVQRPQGVPERVHRNIRMNVYHSIPFNRDELIEKLESKLKSPDADSTAIYNGLMYQLSLQNNIKLDNLKRKFNTLKGAVNTLKKKGSIYRFDEWAITFSMGTVEFDAGRGREIEDLVNQADTNLGFAKARGKDQVVSGPYKNPAMIGNGNSAQLARKDQAMNTPNTRTVVDVSGANDWILNGKIDDIRPTIYRYKMIEKIIGLDKKVIISLKDGRTIFIADHHNHAFSFWWLMMKEHQLKESGNKILHIDAHADAQRSNEHRSDVEKAFSISNSLSEVDKLSNNLGIQSFIAPLADLGFISTWYWLYDLRKGLAGLMEKTENKYRYERNGFSLSDPEELEYDMLDIDIDVFNQGYSENEVQTYIKLFANLAKKAKAISIVMSPEFINEQKALGYINTLVTDIMGHDSRGDSDHITKDNMKSGDRAQSAKADAAMSNFLTQGPPKLITDSKEKDQIQALAREFQTLLQQVLNELQDNIKKEENGERKEGDSEELAKAIDNFIKKRAEKQRSNDPLERIFIGTFEQGFKLDNGELNIDWDLPNILNSLMLLEFPEISGDDLEYVKQAQEKLNGILAYLEYFQDKDVEIFTIKVERGENFVEVIDPRSILEWRRNHPGGVDNPAMVTTSSEKFDRGGIDLTPAKMNLQTKMDSRWSLPPNASVGGGNDNSGIKFYLDPTMLQQLQNAPGFMPVIINVQPLKNLKLFLGVDGLDSR